MLNLNSSTGLDWRKLDLHLHTSASHDFQFDMTTEELQKEGIDNGWIELADASPGSNLWHELRHRVIAAAVVQKALASGLNGIAVTDHDTGLGIDYVKVAAVDTGLVVFPGIEMTCMGGEDQLHFIAIFDSDKGTAHVNAVLAALDITPEDLGKPTTYINKTPLEIIDIVQSEKWNGIVVPAHITSAHGLFKMRGSQRTDIIQHPGLLGVEARDFGKIGNRATDLLNGDDPTYRRKLAVYQASDNPCEGKSGHSIEGIGTCCAYFKMEQINLESLKQCLADPDVRIRQDFEWEAREIAGSPWLRQLTISSGFLRDQTIEFHSGMNSILGGKGTGKSLLVELLRFGLNQPPQHDSILDDHQRKLEQQLRAYGAVEIKFIDQEGIERVVRRQYHPYDESFYDETVNFDPAQVMPVLFLSQNEIIKIAEDESKQLAFIDRFFNFRAYTTQIQNIEHQLQTLDREMAIGLKAYPIVEELEHKLADLDTRITQLNTALDHPSFEKYLAYQLKSRTLENQVTYVEEVSKRLDNFAEIISDTDLPVIPDGLESDPVLSRNRDIIREVGQLIAGYLANLTKAIAKQKEDVQNEVDSWVPDFERAKHEYEQHVQAAGGNKAALANERERAIRETTHLESQLGIQKQRKDSVRRINEQRRQFLRQLKEIYSSYTSERQARCKQLEQDSGARLQLRIIAGDNVEKFRNELLDLRKGTHLREVDIEAICSKIEPSEFILNILYYKVRQPPPNERPSYWLKPIEQATKLPMEKLIRLAEHLLDQDFEHLLRLQYRVEPQDRPEIKYDVGNGNFRPLADVSVGQKSIALLIMALSEGNMPIIIDQPEDSLDIRSIWDDICSKLRSGKEKRQFIFTTHNSSVAVASDSDYFIILESTADRGEVKYAGSMDHEPVSEQVLVYLEGGVETYRRKFVKYRGDRRLIIKHHT